MNTTGSKLLVEAVYNHGLLTDYHESQCRHRSPLMLHHILNQNYQYWQASLKNQPNHNVLTKRTHHLIYLAGLGSHIQSSVATICQETIIFKKIENITITMSRTKSNVKGVSHEIFQTNLHEKNSSYQIIKNLLMS